jgi:hypothetical protein
MAAVVDDRRTQMAALKIRGLSLRQAQVEMAKAGHFNPRTGQPWSITVLSSDLALLTSQWRAAASRDVAEWIRLELEGLDDVERKAREAWERGIGKKQKTVTERNVDGKGGGSKARVETEDLNGDPRFLSIILDCQQRRAKLLGLDAPEKKEHTGPGGGPIQVEIDDATRAERIVALLTDHTEIARPLLTVVSGSDK